MPHSKKETSILPKVFAVPAALLYGMAVQARLQLYRRKWLPVRRLRHPVVSVGNITAGGTGKTPVVECLARKLQAMGHTVSILSRGYKRGTHGIVSVAQGRGPATEPNRCGDEPFLLARNLPEAWVTVAEDRWKAGDYVEQQLPKCVHLLDDAYQHLGLQRTLNILLLDATNPFGGGQLLPWGRLREPLQEMARADLIVVTHADHAFDDKQLVREIKSVNLRAPIVYNYIEVVGLINMRTRRQHPPGEFFRKKVIAFAGIACPQLFYEDLAHHQIAAIVQREFGDHHRYQQREIDELVRAAQTAGAAALITTEKDEINMHGLDLGNFPFYYLRIQAQFAADSGVDFCLQEILS